MGVGVIVQAGDSKGCPVSDEPPPKVGQKDVSMHLAPVLTIPSSPPAQSSSLPSPELLRTICIFLIPHSVSMGT